MCEGKYLFAIKDEICFIKFKGEIRYTISSSLDVFIDSLFENGTQNDFIVDLSEATLIDSTNLGLLAKLANKVNGRSGGKVTLISPNEDIYQVLQSVGFERVFVILKESDYINDIELKSIVFCSDTDKDLAKRMLTAHRALCALSENNHKLFKNIVMYLKQGLEEKP